MGSPAEYVAKIESDLRRANARIARLELERSQSEEHQRSLMRATADAADTTVRAIDRIQELQGLSNAMVEWRAAAESPVNHARYRRAFTAIVRVARAEYERVRGRS